MVYNAMKMFMDINPQLFDECSHEYNEQQNSAEQREKARLDRWDKISELAKDRKSGIAPPPVTSSVIDIPEQIDEVDAVTEDTQERMDSLRIQDDTGAPKERRRVREISQNPVSSMCF